MAGLCRAEQSPLGGAGLRVACAECGLVQRLTDVPPGYAARCDRCDATLWRPHRGSLEASLASALSAAVLAYFALELPLLDLHEVGRFSRAMLFTGPDMMARRGLPVLAAVVVATLVALPAAQIALLVATLVGVRARRSPRVLAWTFGASRRVAPYAMVDVFLLGFFVSYARLSVIAHVDLGPSVLATFGVMISMVVAHEAADPAQVWRALRANPVEPARAAGPLTRCPRCGWLAHAAAGDACPRCGGRLRTRKPHSLWITCALVCAGMVLYVPANVLPMMYVEHLGQTSSSTILGGVTALLNAGSWPLALIVFVASVSVPLLKIVALAAMVSMTLVGAARGLRAATRVYRIIHVIGRWSMLDMFALTTLVGLVHMGSLATVRPGEAALPFCALVFVTMFATETFDTRLMWDAAATRRPAETRP